MSGYATYDIQKLRDIRSGKEKQPFPHQLEAFSALSNTLPFPVTGYKGTMLVLPTGGGKTYTAVNWICRNILSKGIKVLWLAQSSYLLDQAEQTFRNEIHSINGRETINLRVVSSSQQHSNAGSIFFLMILSSQLHKRRFVPISQKLMMQKGISEKLHLDYLLINFLTKSFLLWWMKPIIHLHTVVEPYSLL